MILEAVSVVAVASTMFNLKTDSQVDNLLFFEVFRQIEARMEDKK